MCIFPVLFVKTLSKAGGIFNRGSSLPGKLALKLFPASLSRLRLPRNIIAVTGSNGKTTTAEMITSALGKSGLRVVTNGKGSNQTEGVATAILSAAGIDGKVDADCMVLEVDERYAEDVFSKISPTVLVVTNLFRDQLTRNSDPFFVRDKLKCAVAKLPASATVLLNADDPISLTVAGEHTNVKYFGLAPDVLSTNATDSVYEDCVCCPVCGGKLDYSSYHFSQLGTFVCRSCGFCTPHAEYRVSFVSPDGTNVVINGRPTQTSFSGKYQYYNLAAAFAACEESGLSGEKTSCALSQFVSANGRKTDYDFCGKPCTLLISKHENSTAYNLNLEYAAAGNEPTDVMAVIDRISRKYFSSDTGWVWDINFDILNSNNIKNIYLGGKYAYDAAVRVKAAVRDTAKIHTDCDIAELFKTASVGEGKRLVILTCFADAQKVSEELKKWKK